MTDGHPSDSTEHYDGTPASGEFRGKELPTPENIGRYRILKLIARGGFGSVYLAQDESLEREVAIKIPRRQGLGAPDYSRWMSEARMVAMLDHPNIVPVYDAGSTDEQQFYVVSKFIEGEDLRSYLERERPSSLQSVQWVIAIADALQHAHSQGLVHRDVKPSNILIDQTLRPWLTDFGLALREEEIGREADKHKLIGTVNYMSPEQARGEGHLVDGRADIFSLGVILYELLSGSRPFQGSSSRQLLRNIGHAEPRPLRQWDSRLPLELERICMKALAQRRSDRYSNAGDVAEDLRRFARKRSTIHGSADVRSTDDTVATGESAIDTEAAVIPKGLHAFDEHDSGFFLKLVPGPRDREGIPEILRRLKIRIESRTKKDTFRVGMLYGSSGSGKSSLVRAGLIPLLDPSVHVAYIEATSASTESRLFKALQPLVDDKNSCRGLISAIAAIRRSGIGGGRKVLIVLDQFEQWLHSHKLMAGSELVGAIRQCDGRHVQCVVLIRDDFWMPATQFFYELEIPLIQDVNSTAVDRFDLLHAKYVLSEFGRAYGCLPKDPGQISNDQNRFLDAVVGSVQEDGKVISVHLAVLAQMLKGRPWNPKTLAELGGTEGVDLNFLDATFTGSAAPPHYRSVEAPARAVLAKLLPEAGTNIKGQMHDVDELREAAGLSKQRFQQLLNVLDGELRLITPTVPLEEDGQTPSRRCYQLTHDFLVPPLREWLTRSEQQTVRGRAKLRLRELSQYWRTKQESRFLPNVFEYLRIVCFTTAANRNADENKLVAAATRYHGARWSVAAVVALIVLSGASLIRAKIRAESRQQEARLMVKQLLAADVQNVPRVIEGMRPIFDHAQPLLQSVLERNDQTRAEKLHARLALVGSRPQQVKPLVNAVAAANVDEIELIARQLRPYSDQASQSLWSIIESETADEQNWLHAALALAHLDPDDDRWFQHADRLARVVVSQSTPFVIELSSALRKLSRFLIEPTQDLFRTSPRESVQVNAAVILSLSLQATDPLLADLLVSASPAQFEVLFDVVSADATAVVPLLRRELTTKAASTWPQSQLDGDTPEPDPEIRAALAEADGILTSTLAFCQSLPLDGFEPLAAKLGACGYRPESVRTYLREDETLVAAVWQRDGRSWAFTRHIGADETMQQEPLMRAQELLPTDITVIASANTDREEIEYGVLWCDPDESVIDSKIYVGVTEQDHAAAWGPLNDGKYVPKSNLKLLHPDGSHRYCSVRKKMLIHPSYDDAWHDLQSDYESRILEGWTQIDVRLNPAGQLQDELTWAATWWNGSLFESRTLNLLDIQLHLDRAEKLAAEGFRPVCISVVDHHDGAVASSVWHRPHVSDQEQDRVASRQANAVIALLQLGEPESLWPLLESKPDSRLRSFLIDRLSQLGSEPQVLLDRLVDESDDSRRFAIIAALAQYRPEQLPVDQAATLKELIHRLGTSHPSSGIHAVCEHLARNWQWDDVRIQIETAKLPDDRQIDGPTWFSNPHGQSFVVIDGPVEFQMGSPGHELFRDHTGETSKRVRIPRAFAIAATELTLADYKQFDSEVIYASDYTPSDQCPVNSVSWYDAVKYCRWLSEQENIDEDQMCYPPIENIGEGFELPTNYLDRTGYRLPTEAEWEYACRAGSTTTRHFGYSNELLPKYAWTVENPLHLTQPRLHPVKRLLPNDFGLFDTLGNIMEWCQNTEERGDATRRVMIDASVDYDTFGRHILRGSAIFYPTSSTRSASRERGNPSFNYPYYGFRVARTMPSPGKSD